MQHNLVRTIYHHKLVVTYFYRTTVFYPLAVTNNMTMANAPSADDLRAAFTFSRFKTIIGEPAYETFSKLETQATRNAATVVIHLPPPHTNQSGIVEQPAVYILGLAAPFLQPPYPGDAAHFPVGATLVQRKNIEAAYDANIKKFLTCQTTDNILKLLLENAIEHSYLAGIYSDILVFGVRSLQDIFLHFYQSYGLISPEALQVNTTRLTTPIASQLPIALVFRQIEECKRFAISSGTAFTAEQLIKASETLIIATGKYQLA